MIYRIIVLFVICLSASVLVGQDVDNVGASKRVEAQRVAFLTQRLDLSTKEAEGFFPLYREFKRKQRDIQKNHRWKSARIEFMSDAEAEQMITETLEREARLVDLKREYVGRLKQVISAKKIIALFAAEKEFNKKLLQRLKNRKDRKGNGR